LLVGTVAVKVDELELMSPTMQEAKLNLESVSMFTLQSYTSSRNPGK